ncbi:GerMN domain-containing protein [Agromyces sp. Root81]|uniref:GerMN domain-containing protein n=1 Tax=Agromyces sp. Root81 TaxID=1736601 RepID=UPI000AD82653|nr:GerMN domain-containing protein [Agromyces sp. Root81]
MRRRVLGTSVLAVAVLFAGCVSIPSSGGVNAEAPAPAEESLELDTIVPGPVQDASQLQILEGFIDAAASPRNGYQVARQFLTPTFADEWSASDGATIDVLADRGFTEVGETSIVVDATPAAQLSPTGQYDISESTPIELRYDFEQVEGQWRISLAPPGLLTDQTTFSQVFRSYPLFFYSGDFDYLVPDLRWFAGRDSAQTSIVRALLVGPSDWLAAGVRSAFPEGTRLASASVPVSGRVASVDLSGATDDDIVNVQRMQEQLDESLDGVRNVDDVALSLNGVEQNVPELSPAPLKNPPVDPRPVVFDGTTFGYLATSGEGIEQIPDLSPQVEALAPIGAALGSGGESAAVLTGAGVSIVRAGEEAVPFDPRDGLIVPALDGHGVVWTVPGAFPDQLVVRPADGSADAVQLPVPWSGSSIAALEISRDSTRLVALLGDGNATHFVAASIQRDAAGIPVALSTVTLGLADIVGSPRDVTWLDAGTVASLTALPGGGTRVITQELGGFADDPRLGPDDATAIDGGNSVRDIRLLTSAGLLEVPSGVGWQARASGILLMASQQPD